MPDPAPYSCTCTTLRKASRAVTRLYDEALAPTGMSIAQFAILRNVARRGTVPLSRLADILVMERTTLYRALAPLEKQGWLAITSESARSKAATVTEAGHAAIERAETPWQTTQDQLIGDFGAEQWALLERALNHFSALAQGAEA